MLSVEPFTHADTMPPAATLRRLLELCAIFSPNLAEAESLVGPGSPAQVLAFSMRFSPMLSSIGLPTMEVFSNVCTDFTLECHSSELIPG